jgi:hypothetical protein
MNMPMSSPLQGRAFFWFFDRLPANAAKLDRKAPQVRRVHQDLPGPKCDPGLLPPFRVVTGTDDARCADDEILLSLVCASGATDGGVRATPGTAQRAGGGSELRGSHAR